MAALVSTQERYLLRRILPAFRFAILLSAIATLLIVTDPPTPLTAAPLKDKRPIIAGWFKGGKGVTRPVVLLAQRLDAYTEVNPFSYTIESNGTLTANDPVNDSVFIDLARMNGIKVIPTVESGWETRSLARILADQKSRSAHIDNIMKVARQNGIDGIDLDYENLPPESTKAYTAFVTALATQLHAEGKILSVTVPPKIALDDPCVSCRFADYAALGAVVDRFRVMAYEFHGKGGAPGPIAPVWWMRQVMTYTVSQVPRERVILGIHLYAYDWGGKDTPALWWSEVQALRERYRNDSGYADYDGRGTVGENWLTYTIPPSRLQQCDRHDDDCVRNPGEQHSVWFVDARYVQASWEIVRDLQLGGIVLWRPGGEDPAIWDILTPPTIATTQ